MSAAVAVVIDGEQDFLRLRTSGPDIKCRFPAISTNLDASAMWGSFLGCRIERCAFILREEAFDFIRVDGKFQ